MSQQIDGNTLFRNKHTCMLLLVLHSESVSSQLYELQFATYRYFVMWPSLEVSYNEIYHLSGGQHKHIIQLNNETT